MWPNYLEFFANFIFIFSIFFFNNFSFEQVLYAFDRVKIFRLLFKLWNSIIFQWSKFFLKTLLIIFINTFCILLSFIDKICKLNWNFYIQFENKFIKYWIYMNIFLWKVSLLNFLLCSDLQTLIGNYLGSINPAPFW